MFRLETFYQRREWIMLVKVIKKERENENGILICDHCRSAIIKAYDCIGHHKIELTESNVNDLDISLNPENISLIHHSCHNRIHARFGNDNYRKVYIVYGSPLSGKSTFVKQAAGKNDLIIDMDSIYEMVTNNERYIKPDGFRMNVFGIRDLLIDQIKLRIGKWSNAYVIGGYPYLMERVRLQETLGAEFVSIESDFEICMSRAMERGGKRREYEGYIREWFEKFQPDPDLPP